MAATYEPGRLEGDAPENPSAAQLLNPDENLEVEPAQPPSGPAGNLNGLPPGAGQDVRNAWTELQDGLRRLSDEPDQLRKAVRDFEAQNGPGVTADALLNNPEKVFANTPGGIQWVANTDPDVLKGVARDYYSFQSAKAQDAIQAGGEDAVALGNMKAYMENVLGGVYQDGSKAFERLQALEKQGVSPDEIGAAIKEDLGMLGQTRSGMDTDEVKKTLGTGAPEYFKAADSVDPTTRQAADNQSQLNQAAENNPGLAPDPGNGFKIDDAMKQGTASENDVLALMRNPYVTYQI